MKRWICAVLAGLLAMASAVGLAEDYDPYYDRFANIEADLSVGEAANILESLGMGALYDHREELDGGIAFYSDSSSVSILALPNSGWERVAAFLIMVTDPAEYARGLNALWAIEYGYFTSFDGDSSGELSEWVAANGDAMCRCGAENRLQKWSTSLSSGCRVEVSVTPLPDCTRLNAVLYMTDDLQIDISMGAGSFA